MIAHGVVCKVLLLRLLNGYGPTDWTRVGSVANVAVTELVPDGDGWRAERLLAVPETVLSLTLLLPSQIGIKRSET